ncbi:uncharacterized protein MONOS_18169 [Monocercomonoides exilis]|uniref:uncharacterized protein n=1 Tax=Monocercomonoides exilis TaxID=2049356 RepID=UPI00355A840E|nr:hypothetical protein MONOS_18169 [Monocercomonoides exilis]
MTNDFVVAFIKGKLIGSEMEMNEIGKLLIKCSEKCRKNEGLDGFEEKEEKQGRKNTDRQMKFKINRRCLALGNDKELFLRKDDFL